MHWIARELLTNESPMPEGAGLLKFATVERDTIATESRTVRVVCSTSAPDREKDIITQTGWKLHNYQKNPVVLFGHDYRSLPVGKAVSLAIDGDRLVMETEFATAEENPFADVCYRLVKGGYLNAVSVGFRPIKLNWNDERKGYDFQEQELLEISWVPVPAHPQALVEARDAGIDLTLIKQWHDGLGEQLKALDPEPTPEEVKTEQAFFPQVHPDLIIDGKNLTPGNAESTGELTVDKTAELLATLIKQGRVLSSANENKIRSAVTALSEVLGALETVSDDGKAVSNTITNCTIHDSDGAGIQIRTAVDPDSIDLESITTENDDITLSAEDLTALRATVRELVTAHLTAVTGRVV